MENFLPNPPTFSNELVDQCKQDGDFRPILFEWYKYVGIICIKIASLSPDSPAFRAIPPVHYAILTGLLNRCSRLMVANVRLSCTQRYGETTALLDRSIAETAIKVQWLCHKDAPDYFLRYLADGLKKDLKLKDDIKENINNRGGNTLVIETRMLNSIEKCIGPSGLTQKEVVGAKKLPDFATMCRDLSLGDLGYTAIYRMGSHAVHGTWSDLIFHYLRHEEDQGFSLKDLEEDTQDIQYIYISLLVLEAMDKFLNYVAKNPSEINAFFSVLDSIEQKLVEIQNLALASDFDTE